MKYVLKILASFTVTFVVIFSIVYAAFVFTGETELASDSFAQTEIHTSSSPVPTVTGEPNVLPKAEEINYGIPVYIQIPSVNIQLSVVDGVFQNNTWNITDDKAHYAVITAKPNNIDGNTLIYGHNTRRVFYKTKDLKPGDTVIIRTDNNYTLQYSFTGFELVYPNNTSVFEYKGSPRLTLLTCNGWNDMYRKLMYFDLKNVSKS